MPRIYRVLSVSLVFMALSMIFACGGGHVTEPPVPSPSPSVEPTPGPSPSASPAMTSCPPLVKWGAKVFNVMDGTWNPTNEIKAGGRVVLDSTPRFELGGPNGQPCNDEHPCGRKCEDPRGAKVTQLKGESNWESQNGSETPEYGFQVLVGKGPDGMVAGQHSFKFCPPPGLHDGEDPPQPVEVKGNACEVVSFWVNP